MARFRCLPALLAAAGAAALLAIPAAAQAPHEERQQEQWAVAPGVVLDLPPAWELSQGAGVVVAVVDSGTKLDHPDLAPNAWTNFREVPGNRRDDDGNGYVDDVHGVDLTTERAGQDLSDGNGHGTHVAGIIAAAANRRGVVGVAFRAKIMTVKVLDAQSRGTTGGVAEGIRYAAANGARIINLSLGGPTQDPRVTSAIREAADAGVLIVCSAGNDGRNVDERPSYPVSTAAPNVLGVAATSPDDGRRLGDFSNFGRNTIGLAAPGVEVLSTRNDGTFERKSGTSMAAPHVTGVAALVAALRPDLSASELRAHLLQSAQRAQVAVGAGYVDALAAVLEVATASTYRLGQPPELRILRAVSKRSRGRRAQLQLQAAVLGATGAIRRYRVSAGRRRIADVSGGRTPFTVRVGLRRPPRRVRVEALDARGAVLSAATRRVRAVARGKRGVRRGSGVGSTGGPVTAW
jgi:subtilisin family serine protease